jgi:MFS family permease
VEDVGDHADLPAGVAQRFADVRRLQPGQLLQVLLGQSGEPAEQAGAVGGLIGGTLADRVGRDQVIVTSLLVASPFCVLLGAQTAVGPLFVIATAVSGLLLNGSFVVLAVRGQESLPGSLGMVSGLMLGLSIGLGGLAVAPMAVLAERVGIPVALDVAAVLAVGCALIMRTVPKPPAPRAVPRVVSAEPAD